MFIHEEDNTEVQAKIFNDGSLVICCPKCNTLWANHFSVIPKEEKAVETYDVAEMALDMEARTERSPRINLEDIIVSTGTIGRENQQKMLISAKKAFPKAFIK